MSLNASTGNVSLEISGTTIAKFRNGNCTFEGYGGTIEDALIDLDRRVRSLFSQNPGLESEYNTVVAEIKSRAGIS